MRRGFMLDLLSVSLFPILMIIAGAGDALSLRIPNRLTLAMAALFFPMALATGMPWADIGQHMAMGLGLLILGFTLFSFGLFGGGDAKLLAAAGLWFGTAQALPFILFTALAGGVLALALGIWTLISMSWEIHALPWTSHVKQLMPSVPYGYAFAIGAILAFPESWWMTWSA
jgi:prepilin peptidase CpaA